MLERNNGITFRAAKVQPGQDRAIILQQGAIVNGCQTTMCLVHCGAQTSDCLVQVKIVETDDAWDIAKAANHQNPVAQIELDLARYLRPQLVQKAATDLGYGITPAGSAHPTAVLDAIYQDRIDYGEMKCLYLGLFSRKPNNLFEGNYTELRADVLESLYRDSENEQAIFGTLFLLLKSSRAALEECAHRTANKEYAPTFKRFFQDEKPRYRAYLAVLALCGALRKNLSERSADSKVEAGRMNDLLVKTRELLENRSREYKRVFLLAFQVLADMVLDASSSGSDTEVAQMMYLKISKSAFHTLYSKLLIRIDTSEFPAD
jgi:hypothetical protein